MFSAELSTNSTNHLIASPWLERKILTISSLKLRCLHNSSNGRPKVIPVPGRAERIEQRILLHCAHFVNQRLRSLVAAEFWTSHSWSKAKQEQNSALNEILKWISHLLINWMIFKILLQLIGLQFTQHVWRFSSCLAMLSSSSWPSLQNCCERPWPIGS